MGLPVTFTTSAVFPHIHTGNSFGQVHGSRRLLNASFTILSSSEWKVIMQSLPPGRRTSQNSSTAFFSCSSSPFTSILIAWNVRFAGCGPSLLADAGIAAFITSTSSPVVSIGPVSLFFYYKITYT